MLLSLRQKKIVDINKTKLASVLYVCYNIRVKKKYNFKEFVAACESEDFDKIEKEQLEWVEKHFLNNDLLDVIKNEPHNGDCTMLPCTCPLCLIEHLLSDYKEYTFNEDLWRDQNL